MSRMIDEILHIYKLAGHDLDTAVRMAASPTSSVEDHMLSQAAALVSLQPSRAVVQLLLQERIIANLSDERMELWRLLRDIEAQLLKDVVPRDLPPKVY